MIIVTGAGGSLGQAVVRRLVEAGHKVAAVDIAPTIADAGQSLTLPGTDLLDEASLGAAVAQIAAQGPITGLANVAGGFVWEMLDGGAVATWEKMFRMNVLTTLHAVRAALPHLRQSGGAIVNIAANAAVRAASGMGAYTASKAGVMRLTEALAAEEMANNVRVNSIMPSIIDTPVNRADMPDADFTQWVTPRQVANTIAFLLSEEASAITGAHVPVTGKL